MTGAFCSGSAVAPGAAPKSAGVATKFKTSNLRPKGFACEVIGVFFCLLVVILEPLIL
jgi:hypothetical protein